jgi:hypothetical protein
MHDRLLTAVTCHFRQQEIQTQSTLQCFSNHFGREIILVTEQSDDTLHENKKCGIMRYKNKQYSMMKTCLLWCIYRDTSKTESLATKDLVVLYFASCKIEV